MVLLLIKMISGDSAQSADDSLFVIPCPYSSPACSSPRPLKRIEADSAATMSTRIIELKGDDGAPANHLGSLHLHSHTLIILPPSRCAPAG